LFLKRGNVAEFLSIDECIIGVEQPFRLYAEGKTLPPKILGIHSESGGFHIKAGVSSIMLEILEIRNRSMP
jgi:hypothetical protein